MRVLSPLGAGLLLQFIACIGCLAPVNSLDKPSSSSTDELGATRDEESKPADYTNSVVRATDAGGAGADGGAEPVTGDAASEEVVEDDCGLLALASDAGGTAALASSPAALGDAATAAESAPTEVGQPIGSGNLVSDPNGYGGPDGGEESVDEASADGGADARREEAGLVCTVTTGRCDPTGSCAQETCQFERSGKSCAFTPARVVPFTCVVAGDAPDYSPCDLDDACKPGSVCVADTFVGRDVDDNPVPRRSGRMCRPTCQVDEDCPEGDWCQEATDDANQPIADLRVCHRYCQDPIECYGEPVSPDVRCTPRDTMLGLEVSECSRKPSNLALPPADSTTTGAMDYVESGTNPALVGPSSQVLMLLQTAQPSAFAEPPGYCLSNWDCEAVDAVCVDNACRVGCEQATDCGVGSECLLVGGVGLCSEPCTFDAEAGNTCSVSPNCGCPDDQTCRVNEDQTMSCSAIGEQGYMNWCTTQQQCADGLSCIAGLCRPVCVPGVDECAVGQGECVLTIKSEAVETYTCSGDCDPVDPNSTAEGRVRCGIGAVCLPSWDAQTYPHALCASENPNHAPRGKSGTCADDFDCASGLGCDASGRCQHWCRSESDCESDQTCNMQASIYGVVPRFGLNSNDEVGLCQNE